MIIIYEFNKFWLCDVFCGFICAAEFLTEKMLYWHMANQNRCFEHEFNEKLT